MGVRLLIYRVLHVLSVLLATRKERFKVTF